MARIRGAVGFTAILGACLAGAFHMSVWVICAVAATLVLISFAEHQAHYGRYAVEGDVRSQTLLMLGSTLNAATVAVVAYGIGVALGSLWGL